MLVKKQGLTWKSSFNRSKNFDSINFVSKADTPAYSSEKTYERLNTILF